ncbi:hypothetical protein D3C77_319650 [compost metagenome]
MQQRRIIQALQADHRRDTLAVGAQPQGAPRLAQRAAEGVIDVQGWQCLQLAELGLQCVLRHAQGQQRLPVRGQLAQCIAHVLLFDAAGDQLVERHVALELVGFDQGVEALAQRFQAAKQLGLVGAAHQVELAGGLVAGDARDGAGFIEQLRRTVDPLADVVAAVQPPQARGAEQDQQAEQHRAGHFGQQPGAQVHQPLRNLQRPVRRLHAVALEQGRQQAHGTEVGAEQPGGGKHRDLGQGRKGGEGQCQVADATGDQAQAQPRQG